ncbi:TetR/AcrR family transcriptional regulator [Pararhodobacter sp. SW119]|uniref:TetR/AcrR family transcriptional regulator n=1 Tax=Pararhodobacter sp. SW119 TaxID=2780075 RepID=UPI001AE056A7|nr:TetR/AcrR family transcriptional regulator [Pararhodobacter sp. SW119]
MRAHATQDESRAALGAGEARRLQILDIAARHFRTRGYAAVSMRDIATEAGMRTPSLYYHFPSKDDLVIAVMDRGIAVVRETVVAALDALPPDAGTKHRLVKAMRAHLHALHSLSDYTSANVRIFGQLPEALRSANLPERRAYQAIWSELLAPTCVADRSRLPERVAIFIGAMNATLEWVDPARSDLEALADHLAQVLLNNVLEDVSE